MALQLGALRDALKAANVPDALAREAAEEVAGYDNRLSGIERQTVELRSEIVELRSQMELRFTQLDLRFAQVEQRIAELRAYVDQQLERLNGRMNLQTWMIGFVLALVVAIFIKLFVH